MEQCERSLERLGVDYVDLYQCHRPDPETPLEETLRALDDLVTQGKAFYIGVSEWPAELLDEARKLQAELGLRPLRSNQPQYSMLYRAIEAEVIPLSKQLGHRPDRVVADGAGRADGQVPARRQAAGGLTRHRPRRRLHAAVHGGPRARGGAAAAPDRRRPGDHDGAAGDRLGAARGERVERDRRRVAARAGRRQRGGLRGGARRRRAARDRCARWRARSWDSSPAWRPRRRPRKRRPPRRTAGGWWRSG